MIVAHARGSIRGGSAVSTDEHLASLWAVGCDPVRSSGRLGFAGTIEVGVSGVSSVSGASGMERLRKVSFSTITAVCTRIGRAPGVSRTTGPTRVAQALNLVTLLRGSEANNDRKAKVARTAYGLGFPVSGENEGRRWPKTPMNS